MFRQIALELLDKSIAIIECTVCITLFNELLEAAVVFLRRGGEENLMIAVVRLV